MKNIITIVFAVATMFSFTQCSNNSVNDISNADHRAKVISELMDEPTYMQEVRTAMQTKHSNFMTSASYDMMKEDKAMGTKMMDNMMEMCMTDTAMCKMMMGKTMAMCDMDKDKCKMMMTSMQEHPKGMKNMKDMGMCEMTGVNMEQKKKTIRSTIKHKNYNMKVKYELQGMSCGGCMSNVKRALLPVADVNKVQIQLKQQSAVITMNKSVSVDELQAQLTKAGHNTIKETINN